MDKHNVGDSVILDYTRNGSDHEVTVVLQESPQNDSSDQEDGTN